MPPCHAAFMTPKLPWRKIPQSSALKTVEIGSAMAVMDGQPEDDEQNASKDWNRWCAARLEASKCAAKLLTPCRPALCVFAFIPMHGMSALVSIMFLMPLEQNLIAIHWLVGQWTHRS